MKQKVKYYLSILAVLGALSMFIGKKAQLVRLAHAQVKPKSAFTIEVNKTMTNGSAPNSHSSKEVYYVREDGAQIHDWWDSPFSLTDSGPYTNRTFSFPDGVEIEFIHSVKHKHSVKYTVSEMAARNKFKGPDTKCRNNGMRGADNFYAQPDGTFKVGEETLTTLNATAEPANGDITKGSRIKVSYAPELGCRAVYQYAERASGGIHQSTEIKVTKLVWGSRGIPSFDIPSGYTESMPSETDKALYKLRTGLNDCPTCDSSAAKMRDTKYLEIRLRQ